MSDSVDTTQKPIRGRSSMARMVRFFLITGLLVIGCAAVGTSMLIVDETQTVLVERLGEIVAVYDRPEDRGLHFKYPWPVDSVRRFDRRVHLFDPPGREVFTGDQRNVTVDAYMCWRISQVQPSNPADFMQRPVVRFFRGLGDIEIAQARMESRVQSILTKHLGETSFGSLLSVSDSEAGPDEKVVGLLEVISERIRKDIEQRADESQSIGERWGIEIVDFRIKRLNLPVGNQPAVFERMRIQRRGIADVYRREGMTENSKIKAKAKREYDEILARARAEAERIRGQADADALAILNKAHALDPEFYRVIKTLDTYRLIINDKTTLVLSTSGKMFRLLVDGISDLKSMIPPASHGIDPPNVQTLSPDNNRPAQPKRDATTTEDGPS